MNITLYWAVTGRYLGFELPEKEFLSKTEHDPFKKRDYEHLHELLADPYSGLANYRIDELAPIQDQNEVDGITGATIAGVKDYIVEDAVYTTYTMWHIVHGATQDKVREYTAQHFDENLLLKILNSPVCSDVIWGLESIPPDFTWTEELQDQLLGLVQDEESIIANKAVECFSPAMLANEQTQLKLFFQYKHAGYFVRRKILQKFEEAPFLAPVVEMQLAAELPELNGSMVKSVLNLFAIHQIRNSESEEIIADLLDHKNQFIARKAFQFLEKNPSDNKKVERCLKKYGNKF